MLDTEITLILDFLYEKAQKYIAINALIYFTYGVMIFCEFLFTYDDQFKNEVAGNAFRFITLASSIMLLFREICDIIAKRKADANYLGFKNFLDLTGQVSFIIYYIIFSFFKDDAEELIDAVYLVAMFCIIQRAFLAALDNYEGTRAYSIMMNHTFEKIVYVMILLSSGIFLMGLLFYKAGITYDLDNIVPAFGNNVVGSFFFAFRVMMVDSGLDNSNGLQYPVVFIVYAITCMFTVVIMLNLLISIIGEAHGHVIDNQKEINYKVICELILDIQWLVMSNKAPDYRFIHLIRYTDVNTEKENEENHEL